VDMEALAGNLAARCRRGEGLTADITVAAAGGTVAHVDPLQMQQVLENLVRNAVEAAGGRAEVAISCRTEEGGLVRVSVADRGPGVPGDMLACLFEPFRTSRRNGTGLGLSIVKGIVEAHGGTIDVRNGREGGACFDMVLPGPSPAATARCGCMEGHKTE
jgi:signal transduction histidine kinase